jgi:hypothetical protein
VTMHRPTAMYHQNGDLLNTQDRHSKKEIVPPTSICSSKRIIKKSIAMRRKPVGLSGQCYVRQCQVYSETWGEEHGGGTMQEVDLPDSNVRVHPVLRLLLARRSRLRDPQSMGSLTAGPFSPPAPPPHQPHPHVPPVTCPQPTNTSACC